jgi:genome maintenance exonuclease 1
MNFSHLPTLNLQSLEATTTPAGRMYHTPDGDMPSITTVLSRLSRQSIMEWRRRVGEEEANKISGKASSRGTRIHKLCEDYINNEELEFRSPLDKEMFLSMQPLLDGFVGTVYGQELPLYSKYLGIAGRVDLVSEWNGKLSVIDFKTSSKPKKREWVNNYFYQCTAYCVMFEELTGIPVDRFVVVIAVDGDEPQTFYGKRDDNIAGLINAIKGYYDEKNLTHCNPAIFSTRN